MNGGSAVGTLLLGFNIAACVVWHPLLEAEAQHLEAYPTRTATLDA